ncbi:MULTISPECIES: ATP-binding protein [unclassified Campylobacter]|uniref:ATP-binding protein n=1 Tax=unclassified Campylobacter TaxID=2593542 RepID=UPI001BDA0407|nr:MULTISPECIES: ATP-binding protein [unclassified Campylobacter]MBZ7975299.1 ATP-binding protein [Campylobacter sp. RM12637]MBZ7978372.1 ATP-binding protein [Campylobacter sp. RM12654]MBZ7979032.1 ATP-binding protein [Campylobacter sp. RM12642]MBZ7981650.1 ATP-binding protein [Campylobacter sp. RM12640]MBZ7984372.1 ATP-binding protein [Campylobacter sp. RM12647]MBZ7988529.1 ATP-binding protein [Campylobacter sp. RM12635]MBZ7990199.1 ATP-binding protein [Campylobacter sp. RM9331]MBZ7993157.
MNKYTLAKELFIDNLESLRFINLDKSKIAYHKIITSLEKPLKLVLFYGKPGCGKTFLLNKIEKDLKEKNKKIILLEQPFYSESGFYTELHRKIFNEYVEIEKYEDFLRIFKDKVTQTPEELKYDGYMVMLDEAQMYPNILIEKIRLLSDTRMFKFLFTVHKTIADEDILAQEHFTTRIWESIELSESSEDEIKTYINKKLETLKNGLDKGFFSNKNYKFIYSVTKGNLRTVNMLLYKAFEIYEFYEQERFSEFSNPKINEKVLEMAALDKGLLNA